MQAKNDRKWHSKFIEYTEAIVKHPNYKGIFYERKFDGSVKWVVTGKSESGEKRRKWWDTQCKKHGVNIKSGCYAVIARIIHPTKKHVCQICGKKMDIRYVYPTKRLLRKINGLCGKLRIEKFKFADKDILEITKALLTNSSHPFNSVRAMFNIPHKIENKAREFSRYIKIYYIDKVSRLLSPGVMSNSPDRLDGFHSDGLCHRSKTDKGRHKENLMRYTQDRRAYENWAEGDWNFSNRLMGEFKRFKNKLSCPNCGRLTKMTADHIGPISLGFTHRPMFSPLCNSCNSQKNNRMNYSDVSILLRHEKQGHQVVSWHSKYVWNALKGKIQNDSQALRLSKIMRSHLHNVLTLLASISKKGHDKFLKEYLNPQYSYFDYKFKGFHPFYLEKMKVIKKSLKSENKKKNAKRYIRISFESLEDYRAKKNRRVKQWASEKVNEHLEKLFRILEDAEMSKADKQLNKIIFLLSVLAIKDFSS